MQIIHEILWSTEKFICCRNQGTDCLLVSDVIGGLSYPRGDFFLFGVAKPIHKTESECQAALSLFNHHGIGEVGT